MNEKMKNLLLFLPMHWFRKRKAGRRWEMEHREQAQASHRISRRRIAAFFMVLEK